jgi:glycosyltransferase involved in cell wall biosynthesis
MMALFKADADIYYVRGAGFIVAAVVAFAKIKSKTVVFCGADDPDFDKSKVRLKHKRDRALYFWGLKRCDLIVSQNRNQKKQLFADFGKSSHIIHNGYKKSKNISISGEAILWVANFRRPKRPRMFLELAKRLPEQKFVMIGGSAGSDSDEQNLYFEIQEESRKISNLELKGFQGLDEVEKYILNCRVLINTSLHEGFPNTFLQAWSKGVPVLSFCDPDDLIKKYKLGLVATTLDDMAEKLKLLCDGHIVTPPDLIKTFFDKNLSIEKVSSVYIQMFEELMECKKSYSKI